MKKRILSVIIIGVLGVSGLVCCDNNKKMTTEEKKAEVQKLQEEIQQEDVLKIKEKMSKEDMEKFKNSFDTWRDCQKNVFSMCIETENKDYIIQENNRLIDELLKNSPKSIKKDIQDLKEINNNLMNYLSTKYNHEKGQNEEMGDMWVSVNEYIQKIYNTIEKMEE